MYNVPICKTLKLKKRFAFFLPFLCISVSQHESLSTVSCAPLGELSVSKFFVCFTFQMSNPIGFTPTKELQEGPLRKEHEATRYAQWKV